MLLLIGTVTVIVGFVVQNFFAWYTREPEQEDVLLIDVACQTSPIKRLNVKNYYNILNHQLSISSASESSSSSDDFMNLEFCSSDLNF